MSKTSFKMCTAVTLTQAAETMPLRLLHNDIAVMHETTRLNMTKSRTRLKLLAKK